MQLAEVREVGAQAPLPKVPPQMLLELEGCSMNLPLHLNLSGKAEIAQRIVDYQIEDLVAVVLCSLNTIPICKVPVVLVL